MEMTEKKVWSGKVKGIFCEIVNWQITTMNVWDYYLIIRKDNLGEDFKKLLLRPIKRGKRYHYEDYKLDNFFDMHGGITYYDVLRNEVGKIYGVKIGCDYSHLHDEGKEYSYEIVFEDVKNSVDKFIQNFPNYKIFCQGNGNYYFSNEGIFKGDDFYSNEYLNKEDK